ncbi:MAG TPA: zinc ribbon domain-containing protein [Candidatus Bathyarchaeia archaeon]|nr:zinc ribbon domain-containing protein [Candidatus Bathyarchaeia archaeon]
MEPQIQVSAGRFQHRDLAILVGILSGTLLVVFASENPLSNFQPIDLVIFFSVPALAGGIAGIASGARWMENGAIVGVIIGLVYAILNGLRLGPSADGEQVLFLIMTVPIWGFLGGYGSVLAHRTLERNILDTPVLPWPDTPRPGPVQGPKICENCKAANPVDALYCKNCGSKLGLVIART